MGLFFKDKKGKEKNEINNKKLKEDLADVALGLLKKGRDYEQLNHTTCEFGYVFSIKGHGFEALFKITTDKGTFYFAVQKGSMMQLNFNDALFEETTNTFLGLHP